MVWGVGEIKHDKDLIFVPDFRTFSSKWEPNRNAYVWIVSSAPTIVYIQSAKLTGPNGMPVRVKNFDRRVNVTKTYKRKTTIAEKLSSGGLLKGDRVKLTGTIFTREHLFVPGDEFAADQPFLHLEIIAAVKDGPLISYKSELKLKESVQPGFITR